jgi:hypothetical protein
MAAVMRFLRSTEGKNQMSIRNNRSGESEDKLMKKQKVLGRTVTCFPLT